MEQSTLGAMMMTREAAERAVALLVAEDFFRSGHQKIFLTIGALLFDQKPIDLIFVVEELRSSGDLEEIGGAAYCEGLIRSCPSAEDVESYAQIVLEKSIARQLQRESEILATVATAPDADTNEIINHLRERLDEIQTRKNSSRTKLEYSDDTVLDAMFNEISWLWPGWIPRGSLTLVVGKPGTGKSSVVMDMCKRLILDLPWPDGQELEIEDPFESEDKRPTKLLWLDTESGLGIFRQRLQEWDFPRGHFVFPKDREMAALRVDNDTDWAWITNAVATLRPPMIVVDSLAAAHSGEENSNDSMKLVMLRLADLAREHNIAVVCIHHLNKLPAGFPDWPMTQDMVRGATAIVQYPRSIIGVGTPNSSDPLSHGFMSIKTNVGCPRDPIGYGTSDFGPTWGPVSERIPRQKPIETAKNWLRSQLKDGPRLSADLFKAAGEEKICSEGTLKTASKEIGVKPRKESGAGGRWFWELESKNLTI